MILWDGTEQWVYELQKVGNKSAAGRAIAGMNQGDLGSFQGVLEESHKALKKSKASLKHIIVFSDGDPGAAVGGVDAARLSATASRSARC